MGDYSGVPGRPKVQNRTNVMQLKLMGQTHPTGLTPNLLKLFEARPPLEYKPPPEKRKCPPYSGMAQFVSCFAEKDDPVYQQPIEKSETPAQRRDRIHKLRLEEGARKAAEELEKYDPRNDPNSTGDPYKTLFVAKLNYDTTERNIKREFEAYGPIKRIRLVADKVTNKPRGYAFVEYVHTRDMKAAYKQTDGSKIDNRRVLVDVERGRTVPNWRPRRLGGGLGTSRIGGEDANQKSLVRGDQVQSGGPPRSDEPRARDDRHADREKSRERGRGDREGERERSAERSVERPRDRDREDRHHRDRDKNRDRDRERDRVGRDRDRDRDRRDRDRGGRERGRESERERHKERDRDRERGDRHRDRGGRDREYETEDGEGFEKGQGRSSRDKEYEYNQDEVDRHRGDKERSSYDHGEPEEDYERDRRYRQHAAHGYYEGGGGGGGRGYYEDSDNHAENNERDRYDQMDDDKY